MTTNRGFTLIEVSITAGIVACGLVAAASVFSFAIRANIGSRQMSAATALLADKMEEFRAAPLTDPMWAVAGGSDQVTLDSQYLRVWQVRSTTPRSVTVIVYAESSPLTHRKTELIRATTLASPVF